MKLNLPAWARQPTTIHAFQALAALAAGFAAYLLAGGDMKFVAIAAGIGYAAPGMLINDNTAEPSSVEKFVVDAVTAVAQQRLAAAVPLLVQDGMAVVKSLAAGAPSSDVKPEPQPALAPSPTAPGGGATAVSAVLLACILGLGAALGLMACTTQNGAPPKSTVTVTMVSWPQLVSTAKAFDADLDVVAAGIEADPKINAVTRAQIQQGIKAIDGLVAKLDGTAQPANAKQVATDVLSAIDALLHVVPVVPPEIQIAADLATPLLTAFINDLPAPAAT